MWLGAGIRDAVWSRIMLLALIPAVLSVALFVATLRLKPGKTRSTVLPPQPLPR